MEPVFISALVGVAFVFFAFSVLFVFRRVQARVPDEDREYLDTLPRILRALWPAVRLVDYFVCQRINDQVLAGVAEKLRLAGLLYLMSPRQFIALSIVSLVLFASFVGALTCAVEIFNWAYLLTAAGLGYFVPRLWLHDSLKKRQKQIVRELPAFLDFLTMGIEAGLNMNGAIAQVVSKGPSGPLKNEFTLMLRDLRSGLTRSDALRRMEDRIRLPQVSSFVSAVVQAERMGANLGPTFRLQAEQRRVERFQQAEKLALEAPVKLIFPLVVFIFPTTFAVLMFPIAVKFLQSGVSL